MKLNKKTPQGYLSYSQIRLWNSSREAYRDRYIKGEKIETPAMKFGSEVADYLENPSGEWKLLDELIDFYPYPEREKEIKVKLDEIELLGYFDALDKKNRVIADYKVSINEWKQSKVDKNKQLSYYSLYTYLKYGWIPRECRIHWIGAEKNTDRYGNLISYDLTGEFKTLKTERDITDLGKVKGEIKKAYKEIKQFYEEEKIKLLQKNV